MVLMKLPGKSLLTTAALSLAALPLVPETEAAEPQNCMACHRQADLESVDYRLEDSRALAEGLAQKPANKRQTQIPDQGLFGGSYAGQGIRTVPALTPDGFPQSRSATRSATRGQWTRDEYGRPIDQYGRRVINYNNFYQNDGRRRYFRPGFYGYPW